MNYFYNEIVREVILCQDRGGPLEFTMTVSPKKTSCRLMQKINKLLINSMDGGFN